MCTNTMMDIFGSLRVFLAESSTNSDEMSSSTPTSFLAMQV